MSESDQKNKLLNIPQRVYLVINSQVFPLKKEITTLGRKLDNDLVLQDALVSRYHAEIKYEDGRFTIYDLDSTSGTFLNNKKIKKSILYSGDLILLANIPIMFIDESGSLESEADKITGSTKK
jgi:pSer/pThr/pTyr-binding forkhead associated (FHA) protein